MGFYDALIPLPLAILAGLPKVKKLNFRYRHKTDIKNQFIDNQNFLFLTFKKSNRPINKGAQKNLLNIYSCEIIGENSSNKLP